MTVKAFGAAIKRKEDPRLITGEAKYLDDVQLPGMVYAAILRSPYAHARIKAINTEKAKQHPGVVAVFTGEDFKDLPPSSLRLAGRSGTDPEQCEHPACTGDRSSYPYGSRGSGGGRRGSLYCGRRAGSD
jgi:carbon-monoxide dehydrogenase large subunit